MEKDLTAIRTKVSSYINDRFMKSASGSELRDNTPLISGGIMDSISTMKLVSYLETEFHFEFQAHEVDRDNLDSVELISRFVLSKISG